MGFKTTDRANGNVVLPNPYARVYPVINPQKAPRRAPIPSSRKSVHSYGSPFTTSQPKVPNQALASPPLTANPQRGGSLRSHPPSPPRQPPRVPGKPLPPTPFPTGSDSQHPPTPPLKNSIPAPQRTTSKTPQLVIPKQSPSQTSPYGEWRPDSPYPVSAPRKSALHGNRSNNSNGWGNQVRHSCISVPKCSASQTRKVDNARVDSLDLLPIPDSPLHPSSQKPSLCPPASRSLADGPSTGNQFQTAQTTPASRLSSTRRPEQNAQGIRYRHQSHSFPSKSGQEKRSTAQSGDGKVGGRCSFQGNKEWPQIPLRVRVHSNGLEHSEKGGCCVVM